MPEPSNGGSTNEASPFPITPSAIFNPDTTERAILPVMSIPTVTREFYLPGPPSTYKNFEIRESKLPSSLGPDEVLVKNHAVSLNYRDLALATGNYGFPSAPDLVHGSDMAGEVVAIGKDVKDWKVGDRVSPGYMPELLYGYTATLKGATSSLGQFNPGVLTEYRIFKSESLVKIPDHFTYEEAATLPCAAVTAYNALLGGPVKVQPGDTVLLQGTGGVSIFGLQYAIAAGATVIHTSSSDEKLEFVKKLGAKHLINYNTTPDWDKKVLELTNGRGVDFVLECGGSGSLEKSLNAAAFGGIVNLIGIFSGVGPTSIIGPSMLKTLTIRGIQVGSVQLHEKLVRLIEANPEVTKPVIDKVFPFKETKEAFAYLQAQKHVGKIVITVNDGSI